MKKIFCSLVGFLMLVGVAPSFATDTFSCGPGYVLASRNKIDGLNAKECKKLWCRDLELNKAMGSGDAAASGYQDGLSETTDGRNPGVECYGKRKWCSGEPEGTWAPEYGMYVRGSDDGTTYKSYQKGSCFAWRLEKPECAAGESAILREGEWVCVTSTGGDINSILKSSVRRTGTTRRVVR